jgi:hypothetical protein
MKWIIAWSLVLLFGCQFDNDNAAAVEESAAYYDEAEMQDEAKAGFAAPEAEEAAPLLPEDRRMVRTAEIRMQVIELDSAGRAVANLVSTYGGFIANSEFTNSSYQLSRSLTIRIPADRFDALLAGVGSIGLSLDYQRVHTQDVTEEWVDLESRLATKREVRDRYIDILRNRARTAEDILAAEDKIRIITEEIEAREARLRSLRDRVAFSTLQLDLYQEKRVEDLPGDPYRVSFWHQIGQSFSTGWGLIKNFFLFLIAVWPLWFIVPAVVYGWRRWRRGN